MKSYHKILIEPYAGSTIDQGAKEDHFKFLHSGRMPGGFDYAVTRGVMLWLGAYPSPN